jgi:hypothetical protein
MAPPPASDKAEPFKSLLAAWSLAVVVVAVAGFSLHWTYFYNFGLQNQVLEAPLASLPIYAIEMVRNGENLLTLLISAIVFLLPFQALLLVLRRSANAQSPGGCVLRTLRDAPVCARQRTHSRCHPRRVADLGGVPRGRGRRLSQLLPERRRTNVASAARHCSLSRQRWRCKAAVRLRRQFA